MQDETVQARRRKEEHMELLKTPLYDEHIRCGGKMVEFGGYLLPVQYGSGVIAEHMAVRKACGLFDVSHMGEFMLTGADAVRNLNHLLTNDYTLMKDGQARYSPMCYENGGTVDDLIVYRIRGNEYFIVVNAANKDKDYAWMKEHIFGEVRLEDISSSIAQIALQGPGALGILSKLTDAANIPKSYYTALFERPVGGFMCTVSRTGYTGEDGFEFYVNAEEGPGLWELLLKTGREDGLIPCGLGARDTLRLEASMPLYGHELSPDISPVAAGLGTFVHLEKEKFIGKEALVRTGTPAQRRVGLKVTGKGIIREHQEVMLGDRRVGTTTSGTHCPYLGFPVAMAMVDQDIPSEGGRVEVIVRGRRIAAETVKLPFYRRQRGK